MRGGMVPSPPSAESSNGTLLTTVYGRRALSGQSADDGGSPVRSAATKVPSGFFTSTFSPPGSTPSSGGTDWAIQSAGRSKLTVFAGSENVFHEAAVAAPWGSPGVAEAEAGAPPEAPGEADAVPDDVDPGAAVPDGAGC